MTRRLLNNKSSLVIRLKVVVFAVFIFASLLVYRLARIQLLEGGELQASAARQQSTSRTLVAERGRIFYGEAGSDEEYPVATNKVFKHLYAVPRDVVDVDGAINKLFPLVEPYGLDEETLYFRIGKQNDIYEPLLHKLTDEEIIPFIELELPGISFEDETWRYYPEGELFSHITGFVGMKGEEMAGQYGLEGFFEEELRGDDGFVEGKTDISGRLIQTGELNRVEPKEGIDLFLTIDRALQAFACQKLVEKVKDIAAESGTIIAVNPKTGAVLVMCSTPGFDPNKYNEVGDLSVYLNQAVSSTYEPGSIFKPFTMAAAIDNGSVTSQTTYIDDGFEKIGKYTIRNSDGKAHGEVDMVAVLNESLNTGAIFVQRQLGNNAFREYVEKFGFGRTTDIEFGNELSGDVSSLRKNGDIYAATASFGQGITVTPMQVVMGYSAIANGGKLMRPFIVKKKMRDVNVVATTEPSLVDEPISVRASTIVSGMLVSVVKAGHAKSAGVRGYYIAGKTGTAQVAEGGEYGQKTIHSFAGFGPVDDPVFAMLIKLDYPEYGRFAASTAAPLFGDIAGFILQYYEVPPDEE